MAANIDYQKYAQLLVGSLPAVIETEQDKQHVLSEIDKLMQRGEGILSPEEEKLLILMAKLVQVYESERYSIKKTPPHIILQELMEARGLRQRDLLHIFRSRGIASEVVSGQRAISKRQARSLGGFFHVSPELFLWGEVHEAENSNTWAAAQPVVSHSVVASQTSFSFMVEAHQARAAPVGAYLIGRLSETKDKPTDRKSVGFFLKDSNNVRLSLAA